MNLGFSLSLWPNMGFSQCVCARLIQSFNNLQTYNDFTLAHSIPQQTFVKHLLFTPAPQDGPDMQSLPCRRAEAS